MRRLALAFVIVGSTLAVPAAADEPLSPAPLIEAPPPLLISPDRLDLAPEAPISSPRAAEELPALERPQAVGPGLRVARIAVGTLGALTVGFAAGVAVGYGSYLLLCGPGGCNGWNNLGAGLFAIALGGAGAIGGVPLGALLGGKLMGGKGSYGWAMLGMLVGAGGGFGAMYALSLIFGAQAVGSWATIAALSAAPVGAAMGFEFSSWRNEQEAAHGEAPHLAPLIALGPSGGHLGLVARF